MVATIIVETTMVTSSVMSSAMMMMMVMMIALQRVPQASLQDNCFYFTSCDVFSHTLVIMRTIIVITVTTITTSSWWSLSLIIINHYHYYHHYLCRKSLHVQLRDEHVVLLVLHLGEDIETNRHACNCGHRRTNRQLQTNRWHTEKCWQCSNLWFHFSFGNKMSLETQSEKTQIMWGCFVCWRLFFKRRCSKVRFSSQTYPNRNSNTNLSPHSKDLLILASSLMSTIEAVSWQQIYAWV